LERAFGAQEAFAFWSEACSLFLISRTVMTISTEAITEQVNNAGQWVQAVQSEVSKVVVGQTHLVERLLIGLLTNGHILLEGVPGLAKTLAVKTVAACIHTQFRAPAKVQSALLEAMQERHVTIGEATYQLPDPFLVMATQNPLEQEGTYQLPEAQLDRFMLKLNVTYPSKAEERKILDLMGTSAPDLSVQTVISPSEIIRAREVVNQVFIDDRVKDYIVDLVWATRNPADYQLSMDGLIRYGASPRATIYLTLAARAHAFLAGRGYVTPHDVKSIGPDVLRHRIIVSYEAEAEDVTSESIIQQIFAGLPVP
jgi:MoxR-like ATPase